MKYQPNQSIVDYNDWDLATSSVITGDFTTDSLKYGFGPTSLSAEDWLPEGNWVDLGYDNAPTEDQLRSQIEAGEHNDAYGDLGCPDCGNVDLFWKTHSSKGQRYRCLSCEYSSNWETVKSQGDLTLQKFGLTVDCPLCSETISAYNRASIDSHFRKHKKEEAEAAEASEPKVSEAEWDMNIDWNSRCPKCGKSADNPVRTKEYDGYVRTTYYCDCDVGQPNPDFENRFISEYLRWFGSPASTADQVLYGHTAVKASCMGHHDFFPRDSSFIGYDVEEIERLEELLKRRHGLRVSLPRPEPEQTLGPDDLWLEVYSKPSPSRPSGNAGESTCGKCVEKLMSGATYSRGYRPKAMIRWSDWKNDDWDKTVELSSVSLKSEWQEEVEWNDKPKKKTEPEWEDVEWESEQPRKCCECNTTEGLTTIQAGTFCWNCLPINLGAEDSWILEMYEKPNFMGNRGQINVWGEQVAPQGTIVYRAMPETDYNIALGIGYLPSASHNVGYLKKYDYAVFTSFSPTPTRFQSSQSYSEKFEMEYPIYEIDISGLQVFIVEPELGNQGAIVAVIEPISVDRITPLSWGEDYKMTLMAEDNYWAGSVAKAIVNEMGDDYYFNEDLHEYNCVHFAQEMSEYLTQDGIPHEIQSFAGYGGEVAHAWVYVPSEGEYYDAWTPYGVSDWKDLDFWETLDYTPEWLEQQTPESFEAEDDYDAKNQEYVDDLLSKYPNIPVVHAKTIHDITDTDTIYRIDFPLTMYRATSSRTGTEKIGEIGYLQGTNKNYGMYFDAHFNDGEQMKESDFATVPVRKVYGALTMGAPMKQYLPKDAGELLAIDLEGYYIISVRGDFWLQNWEQINEHAVPAVLGDVQAEDVLMLFEPTMMSAEESESPTPTQLLNWLSQPKTITTEKPFEDWEREPTRCVWCSSGDIDSETPEHQEEGLIYSYVGCKDCGCIWREEYRYVDNEVIEEGEKRILKSESMYFQESFQNPVV